jgi:hypothetical protein
VHVAHALANKTHSTRLTLVAPQPFQRRQLFIELVGDEILEPKQANIKQYFFTA